jgi:hypothetical protein
MLAPAAHFAQHAVGRHIDVWRRRERHLEWIMAEFDDPPGDTSPATLECRRCHVRVEVTGKGPMTIAYDIGEWLTRCCCSHLSGPVQCCSFLELERLVIACRAN